MRFRLMLAAVVAVGLIAGIRAQKAADGDWPMYARDLAGTKFSPLKQITADNVGRLQPVWNRNLVGNLRTNLNPEVTPIVVNGVMYLLSGAAVITALDAATGQQI